MAVYLMPVDNGQPIALDKTVLFIGRHPDCDIVLTNSRKISRKHCCIAQVDNRLVIRDLGSMNGVRVNRKRVKKLATINLGDEISVGDLRFIIQVDDTPRRAGSKERQGSVPNRKPQPDSVKRRPQPIKLSGDLPVIIPDEEIDFSVEDTSQRRPAPLVSVGDSSLDDVIPLDDSIDDSIDDSGSEL